MPAARPRGYIPLGFARAAQRVALMVRRNLRLNLVLADKIPLLPLGIWFDSGFWPVSNSPLPPCTHSRAQRGCVWEAMEKSSLEKRGGGEGRLQNDCEKGPF